MRQRHGPAELGGRGLLVTLLASLQALEYRLGEFGLAGVVGDPRVDPGGQRLVIGPDRPDEPLPEDLVPRTPGSAGRGAHHQADPSREHFLPDADRVNLDADMVIAALPRPPRPGRVITGLRARRGAPAGPVGGRRPPLLCQEGDPG